MKVGKILCVLLFLFTLTGCMRSLQLNERAIVQAVGVDIKGENYQLTIQIFDPVKGEKGETSGGKMLQVEGKTLSEAMRNANLKQGQEIFLGDTKLIILGHAVAQTGMKPVMTYFSSENQSRPNMDVLIAEGDAADVLCQPLDSTILPILSTKMMLEGYQDNGKLVRSQLRGVIGTLENPSIGAYLPVVRFSGDEENPAIQVTGTAIFCDDRIVGSFSPEETRGILWACGEVGKTQLTLEDQQLGTITLDVVSAKTKVSTSIKNGAPFFAVTIQVHSNVREEIQPMEDLSRQERYDRYEQLQSQLISGETTNVLERLFHELHCDALGYANLLMQQQPDYWKEHGEEYEQNLSKAAFSVTVESKINRGMAAES